MAHAPIKATIARRSGGKVRGARAVSPATTGAFVFNGVLSHRLYTCCALTLRYIDKLGHDRRGRVRHVMYALIFVFVANLSVLIFLTIGNQIGNFVTNIVAALK